MNTSRKEKQTARGLFFRISSPRTNSNNGKTLREQAPDHEMADSIHTKTSISSHQDVDLDDDDPVEMLKQLRTLRKARHHISKGLGTVTKGTSKLVKGTSRNVAKGSHMVVKGTQKAARAMGGGSTTKQTSPSSSLVTSPQSTTYYDVEAAVSVEKDPSVANSDETMNSTTESVAPTTRRTAAMENDPLIPKETTAPQSSGAALWAKLRERTDDVVFRTNEKDESVEMRKTRHQKELKDEFRSALEFSVTHCLLAIVLYLGIAVLAFSFIFEHWTIIDSCYFAVVSFTTIGA